MYVYVCMYVCIYTIKSGENKQQERKISKQGLEILLQQKWIGKKKSASIF